MIKNNFVTAICAGLLMLTCTTSDKIAGGSTETTNAMVVGTLYQPDGITPAVGAKVYVRMRNVLADTATGRQKIIDSLITDATGKFTVDTIDTGTYVIDANDLAGNVAMKEPVTVTHPESTVTVVDTLKAPGAIAGTIVLSEGGNVRKVFVLAYGLDRFVVPDTSGRFVFGGLAEGTYHLLIITSLDEYGEIDTVGVRVVTNATTELGMLELPFSGIPTPKALSASYDTLSNMVTLSWSTESPNLVSGYKVYRREGAIGLYGLANGSLLGTTSFVDNLANGLEKGKTYQYMVRAVDINENEGLNSDPVTVRIAFFVDAGKDTAYQLGDSVTLRARIDSSTVTPTEYRFDANGDGTNELVSASISTFKYAYADTGTYKAVITIQASSRTFSDTIRIIIMPKDTAGAPAAPRNLSLSYDTLKQIVTLTWAKNYESDVVGYNVYRRNIDSNTVLSRINIRSIVDSIYRDSTGVQDQTYEYRVTAVDKNVVEGAKSVGMSANVIGMFTVVDSIVKGYAFGVDGNFGQFGRGVLDSVGNFYITDNTNKWLQKLGPTGNFIFKVDTFAEPVSITNHRDSVLYVCDYSARKIVATGLNGNIEKIFTTVGRPGGACTRGDSLFVSSDSGVEIYDLAGIRLNVFRIQFYNGITTPDIAATQNGKVYIVEDRGIFEIDLQLATSRNIWLFPKKDENQQARITVYNGDTLVVIAMYTPNIPIQTGPKSINTNLYMVNTTGNFIGRWYSKEFISGFTRDSQGRVFCFSDGRIFFLTK